METSATSAEVTPQLSPQFSHSPKHAKQNGNEHATQNITASAAPVITAKSAMRNTSLNDQEWQSEAWRLYDLIGELRFVSNFMGGAVSRCKLGIYEVDDDGEPADKVKTGPVARLARIPLGSGPKRDENLRLLGIGLYVPGEYYIVGESAKSEMSPDHWYVVSANDISRVGDVIVVNRPRDVGGGKLAIRDGDDNLMLRIWTPHPKLTDQADSPARAAIPVLTELLLLMKREFAELESRLAGAGIQWLPEGVDFPRSEDDIENGIPEGLGGFVMKLAKIAEQGINDQASASALLPIFATIPDQFVEHIDKLTATNYWSDLSENITNMVQQALSRLSLALDIPPEILSGAGDSNRWNAWLADEQVIKIHLQPILSRISNALNLWLHPVLEFMGLDPAGYTFAFDTAPLAVRPNRTTDALEFWDRGLMDDDSAREAGAFADSTKMNERQRIKHLVMRAAEREPSLLSDPTLRGIIGINGEVETDASEQDRETDEVPRQDGRPRETQRRGSDSPRALPNDGDGGGDVVENSVRGPSVGQQMLPAARMVVLRALELAGGRLTTNTQKKRQWPDVPRHLLHCKVGEVSQDKARKVLADAWMHVPAVAGEFGVDEGHLTTLLEGYCMILLTQGLAHDDEFLVPVLDRAAHSMNTT